MAEEECREPLVALQRRRAPALAVPGIADHRGEPGRQHVDGDARDDLVAALRDRGEAVHERKQRRGADAGEEAPIGRARGVARRRGREGGDQQLALEADVDDAGALRPEAGEAGAQEGDRQPQGRVGEGKDGAEIHSSAPLKTSESRTHCRPGRRRRSGTHDHDACPSARGGLASGGFRCHRRFRRPVRGTRPIGCDDNFGGHGPRLGFAVPGGRSR